MGCRIRKNQIVQVEFYDHVEDDSEPWLQTVWGRVVEVKPKHIVIHSWCCGSCTTPLDPNCKPFTIVRSTIRNLSVLEPKKSSAAEQSASPSPSSPLCQPSSSVEEHQ